MTDEQKLQWSLAILRFSIGIFFLIWSLEKLLAPELTQRVFKTFYGMTIPVSVSYTIGIVQTAIVIAFLAGVFKTFSHGALLAMHTVSVLSSYERLLYPYTPPNHLFWAGVPVPAALVVLFLLRHSDRRLTLSNRG